MNADPALDELSDGRLRGGSLVHHAQRFRIPSSTPRAVCRALRRDACAAEEGANRARMRAAQDLASQILARSRRPKRVVVPPPKVAPPAPPRRISGGLPREPAA